MSADNRDFIFKVFQFVFGTLALGLLTIIVNREIQTRQMEQTKYIERKKLELEEMKLLGEFVQTAINAEPGARRRFAEYFASLTTSQELRGKWEFYRDEIVGKEINNIRKNVLQLQEELTNTPKNQSDRRSFLITQINHFNSKIEGNLQFTQFSGAFVTVPEDINKLKKEQKRLNIQTLLANEDFQKVLEEEPFNEEAILGMFRKSRKSNDWKNMIKYYEKLSEQTIGKLSHELVDVVAFYDQEKNASKAVQTLEIIRAQVVHDDDLGRVNRIYRELKSAIDFKLKHEEVVPRARVILKEVDERGHHLRFDET